MILGPDNKRAALRVDSDGRLLVSGGGGGGGGGFAATVFNIPSGGTVTVTTPGAVSTSYSEHVAIIRQPATGSPGTFSLSGHGLDGTLPPIRAALGAELLLYRYTTDSGASWRAVGLQPGESIGEWALADLLALSATTYSGCVARTTVNGASVLMEARNGRWRYLAGNFRVGSLTTPPAASAATTYTIPAGGSCAIPGNLRGVGDRFDVTLGLAKVGSAGTAGVTLYCGTAGTTADPVIRQSATGIAAGSVGGAGFEHRLLIDAAGTIRALGSNNPIGALDGAETAPSGTPASVAVTGLTGTGTLYISVGPQVANAADTMQLVSFEVTHHMAP